MIQNIPNLTKNKIREILFSDIRIFAKYASNNNFKIYNHIDFILNKLQQSLYIKKARILIEMPPRHGKTESLIYFIAYYLKKFTAKNVIYCCYSAELAQEKSRKIKNIIETTFGTKISKDYKSMRRFELKNKSNLIATGIFGSITGRGADILVIDDLIKSQEEAFNENYMNKIYDYYQYVLYTRLFREANIIVINTRWSDIDFSSFLRKSGEYEIITIPAIAESENDFLNRKIGEPICENMFTLQDYENIKKNIGIYAFEALYQQKPLKKSNTLFQKSEFLYFDTNQILNLSDYEIVFSTDIAVSDSQKSDYTVIIVFLINKKKEVFVYDVFHEKTLQFQNVIIEFYKKYKPSKILFEEVSLSLAFINELKKYLLPIKTIKVTESKIVRAQSLKILYENKIIFHNSNLYNLHEIENELLSFPYGKHDDIVDAMSLFAKYFRSEKEKTFSFGKIY